MCEKRIFKLSADGSRIIYKEKFEVEMFTPTGSKDNAEVRFKCVTCSHERQRRSEIFVHIRKKHIESKLHVFKKFSHSNISLS